MATIADARRARGDGRFFHVWMAGVFILIAFGGFIPSYWAKIATHSFDGPRILHVHGMILFSWTLFYFAQTALVAGGRTMDHRAWGLAGISLFTVVVCTIVAGQVAMLNLHESHGFGDQGRRFAAVSLFGLPLLIGFFTAAIVQVRRPEVHKRLMFLLMTSFMPPAIARVIIFLVVPPGDGTPRPPPPPSFAVPPMLIASLLILVAMLHDKRTIGRVHPVYIWGGLAILAQALLMPLVAGTSAWLAIARGVERLAG